MYNGDDYLADKQARHYEGGDELAKYQEENEAELFAEWLDTHKGNDCFFEWLEEYCKQKGLDADTMTDKQAYSYKSIDHAQEIRDWAEGSKWWAYFEQYAQDCFEAMEG